MKYRVGGDDWWRTFEGEPVLETDIVYLVTEDDVYYYMDVYRDDRLFGSLTVHKVFLEQDFEEIEE